MQVFSCDQCEFNFISQCHLKEHKTKTHKEIQFSCNECNFHAKNKGGLTRHINAQHKNSTHPCEFCEYSPKNKLDLVQHINSDHQQVYNCNKCSFTSTNNNDPHATLDKIQQTIDCWDGVARYTGGALAPK